MSINKLRAMEIFVRTMDEGSLTAAAGAANLSQPSLVRQLATLDFNLNAPAIDACLEGAGFGMFFSYQVEHAAAGRLRIVLQESGTSPMPMSIVYPQAKLLPQRTRLLIDWLREALSEGETP